MSNYLYVKNAEDCFGNYTFKWLFRLQFDGRMNILVQDDVFFPFF